MFMTERLALLRELDLKIGMKVQDQIIWPHPVRDVLSSSLQ